MPKKELVSGNGRESKRERETDNMQEMSFALLSFPEKVSRLKINCHCEEAIQD